MGQTKRHEYATMSKDIPHLGVGFPNLQLALWMDKDLEDQQANSYVLE